MMKVMFRFLLGLLLVHSIEGFAQTTNYKTHAIFIYSIAKYSKWPATESGEFVITVLGKSKLYDELLTGSANHSVGGQKISVQLAEDISQIKRSQIIIVSDGKSGTLDQVIETTNGQPVMIITERENLYKKGAGISFFVNDEGKLNFDMNLTEMNKRTLSLSQSLTKLATKVI